MVPRSALSESSVTLFAACLFESTTVAASPVPMLIPVSVSAVAEMAVSPVMA